MPCTNDNPIVKSKRRELREGSNEKINILDEEGTSSSSSDRGEKEIEGLTDDQKQIDSKEIFNLIRSITDPEYPMTLEDLSVVSEDQITVNYPITRKIEEEEEEEEDEENPHIMVRFTPTIPHCSMATLIGLTLRVRLLRSLPEKFKVDIKIKEGTHQSENSINKQLNDKERVAAALENNHLLGVVQQCLSTAHLRGRKKVSEEQEQEIKQG